MESGLKQRLVGALVLIVAAVIFLPMLLTGQDETVEIEVEVPEPVALPVPETRPAPVLQPREPAPVAAMPSRDAAPAAAPETEVAEQPVAPDEPPLPAAEPQAPAEPPAASGDWVVQLGSFGNSDNASGLVNRLLEQGYNAYSRSAEADGQSITRVFVGPLTTREAATRLRDEIKRNQEADGFVAAHDESTRRL